MNHAHMLALMAAIKPLVEMNNSTWQERRDNIRRWVKENPEHEGVWEEFEGWWYPDEEGDSGEA